MWITHYFHMAKLVMFKIFWVIWWATIRWPSILLNLNQCSRKSNIKTGMSINLTFAAFLWWIFGCIFEAFMKWIAYSHKNQKIPSSNSFSLISGLYIDFSFFLCTNCSWIFAVFLICAASQGLGSWRNSTPVIARTSGTSRN